MELCNYMVLCTLNKLNSIFLNERLLLFFSFGSHKIFYTVLAPCMHACKQNLYKYILKLNNIMDISLSTHTKMYIIMVLLRFYLTFYSQKTILIKIIKD